MDKSEKFIIWCDKVMAFSFYALIYFLPISIALSETFTGIALVVYLVKRGVVFYGALQEGAEGQKKSSFIGKGFLFLRSYKPVDNYLNWPIFILLFFSFISVITSQHPSLSFEGFLGKTLQSAFLYFTFIECINSKKRLKIFLSVLLISCALVCINGLYQSLMGQGFIHGHPYGDRVYSSFRHSNDFGAYLVFMAPLLLSLSVLVWVKDFGKLFHGSVPKSDFHFFSSKRGEVMIFILFLLVLACLGLTYSRGAWVAFSIVILFLGIFSRRVLVVNIVLILIFFMGFYSQLTERRGVSLITDSVKKEIFTDKGNKIKINKIKPNLLAKRYNSQANEKLNLYMDNIQHITVPLGGINFGNTDFTIDYWYYPKSINNDDGHFAFINNIGDNFYLRGNTLAALELGQKKNDYLRWHKTFAHNFEVNQWYHIAIVKKGLSIYSFVNGENKTITPIGNENFSYKFAAIGFWDQGDTNSGFAHGFITNFRITKGVPLFTSDFNASQLFSLLDQSVRLSPEKTVSTGLIGRSDETVYALDAHNQDSTLVLHENKEVFGEGNNFGRYFINEIYTRKKEFKPKFRLVFDEDKEKWVQTKEIKTIKSENFVAIQMRKFREVFQKFGGSGRYSYWEEAMNMVKDYPMFGAGLNTYSIMGRSYKISWGGYPHNCYLQMAAEIGLLGLVSFLWILIIIFRKSIQNFYSIKSLFLRELLAGTLAGFGGFLIQSFFDTSFYSVQLGSLMWIVMGLIIAIQRVEFLQN